MRARPPGARRRPLVVALLAAATVCGCYLAYVSTTYTSGRRVVRKRERQRQMSVAGTSLHDRDTELTVTLSTDALRLLANPVSSRAPLDEETLTCVQYSGPCFFMNHPDGIAPTQQVPAARLPADEALEHQPALTPATLALQPFSLHDVRLLPGTRFHTAQQTNVEWLRRLEPDRLL